MVIRQQMICVRSSYCMFLVILICASSVGSLENRKRTEDVSLSQLVDPVTGKVVEGMAELLWISCRLDLLCLKEAKKDLNFCYPEETSDMASGSNSDGRLLTKRRLWKMIKVQNPQLKQTLLDCMRKNNIMLHVSGQSGSSFQHTRYLDSILPMPTVPKRNLLQSVAEVPAPAPALVPADGSPFLSPGPSPDLSPSPASAPSPVPTSSPVSAPPPRRPFFPQPGDRSPPLLPPFAEDGSAASASGPSVEPGSHRHNRKVIIIAVAVTAAVTFVFAALFFFCCTKICQKRSRGRQNDEKPLLGMSLTDYSTGSPRNHKSFGLVNANNEEKADHQSINKNSSHQRKDSSLDNVTSDSLHASSDEIALSAESFSKYSNTIAQVPSPGRVDNLLPLKPPPGRAVPLPPEPPASLRPPTRKADPPPPPRPSPPPPCAPPVPPPKASGSVGPGPPGPPPPPPMAPGAKPRPSSPPPPPPPPKAGPAPPQPPPPLPMGSKVPRPPTGLKHPPNPATGEGDGADGEANTSKAKLKPFFWDKVLANPDHSMVWHQIKSGSFQFNEEMIETLFGYAPADRNKTGHKKDSSSQDPTSHFIQILDTKKAQNLSILLRALNVTTEKVCDALHEGNELPVELLQTLLKMAPTADEELKLRLYTGELSELGNAERFLKALVDIPFAYKRLEALLFMCTLREDVGTTKESFETLEIACKELRNSRLFLKLLEAVLKTGNRMNDGTYRGGAQAFKLDTLLKLSDVRGKDGKTTLLHFVVQEIIRSEGAKVARAARESQTLSNISVKTDGLHEGITPDTEHDYGKLGLQVVSRLSSELENVKKAANIDSDSLTGTVAKLGFSLLGTQEFLTKDMNSLGEESKFHETLKSFVQNAEVDIMWLLEEEKRIMALVKGTGDYFHGKAGKDEGLRLFVIVRDFLIILDKVCKQVEEAQKKAERSQKKESSSAPSHSSSNQQLSPDFRPRLFPAIPEQDFETSSSDGETE